MDIPRSFTITEGTHRIHNPLDDVKLATLGRALRMPPGASILDLGCGSGEMLCTWARDHGVTGTGVDLSTTFLAAARTRAVTLGVADQVDFIHRDAAGYVAASPVDVAACLGASWIGDGPAGTLDLLRRSLAPGGMVLLGEPYWRREPENDDVARACYAQTADDYLPLPELVEQFAALGTDLVEMVLADQDSWDRYVAPQWMNIRRWLDANPDDELATEMRDTLSTNPARHIRYLREYLGWGVFVLMDR